MALARELAGTLRRLHGDTLDPRIAARMRLHVADTIGVALAARADAALCRSIEKAAASGPAAGAAIIGSAARAPAPAAAFANAALAHAMDFDDIHDYARLHPTPVTLAAALAVATDPAGAPAPRDWTRLTGAVALGNEALCRLGLACAPDGSSAVSNWFTTQLLGGFGAALAAGWMMGLDDAGLEAALGFAGMQAAGHKEPAFGVGSNARQVYPGFAAMAGVTAARMAAAGLSAPAGAIDGAAGVWRVYLGRAPDEALRALALEPSHWHATEVSFKPWPCCRLSHPYVSAALALRERLAGRPIERLVVGVNPSADRLCWPLDARVRPATLSDAKYSIPFITAWTIVHGEPSLERLDARALSDPAVLALAARIAIEPGLPDRPGHPPARLHAWPAGGGAALSSAADAPPELDAAGVRAKFLVCARHGGLDDGEALWEAIVNGAPAPLHAVGLA